MPNLSAGDRKIVVSQLKALPPRTKAAQEKEMGEMMGKLKQARVALSPRLNNLLTFNSSEMVY
jgi:hypothetical protein